MNWALFMAVLIQVESHGDKNAVGDPGLPNHAYGLCQLRQPYVDDVNRIRSTSHPLRLVAGSRVLSEWAVKTYVAYYGERYEKLTGKPMTMEVAARIHNGGPSGWAKKSTDAYWSKFEKEMKKQTSGP